MHDWLRRLGSLLLTGVEAVLALGVLFAVWILLDIGAGVEGGAYNPEAASGFVIGFFALWLIAGVGLALVAGGHAAARAALLADDDGTDALRDWLARLGVELLVAGALYVAVAGLATPYGAFGLVLGASAVASAGLLVHVAVDAAGFVRGLATAG